ncbi:hypothetical protein GGR57DRAFT_445856 [Xylariaceae sp. FL1272]|nr:hypothetical protein GGR57DRAFT_445856 [Xylariaceae sp. FL1272]
MQSPPTSDLAFEPFDSSRPFEGLVLCCTSIEADLRNEIAQRTADLGGVHKYDLTPDVTHLLVGDYNTPKYRHVAKERPDIKPMAAGWVDAVRQLWVEDQEIDMAALETAWMLRPFESSGGIPNSPNPQLRERQRLVCCLTGFEDNAVRAMIEAKVRANGGDYVADLSRRVTHLITFKPEGKKYLAARKWDIRCVSIEWLHDSAERAMILNEDCYDPSRPPEERGRDAWSRRNTRRTSLGKRTRDGPIAAVDESRRKFRKSASMRMSNQSSHLWGDILSHSADDLSRPEVTQSEPAPPPLPAADLDKSGGQPPQHIAQPFSNVSRITVDAGVLSGCRFFVSGFSEAREALLFKHLASHGGKISSSLSDVASLSHGEPLGQRYLLVPQSSHQDDYPIPPDGIHVVTEFFIERCIHNKRLYHAQDHVLGRPFPSFPINGFQNLTINAAGIFNEQLNQVEKAVTQLGATYSEKLNKEISVIICPDLSSLRIQKRDFAILNNIPIVNMEWLWRCIATGSSMPLKEFHFVELSRSLASIRAKLQRIESEKKRDKDPSQKSQWKPSVQQLSAPKASRQTPPLNPNVDTSAFDDVLPRARTEASRADQREKESQYKTAPTHQAIEIGDAFTPAPAPLSEKTASNLNMSASPPKQIEQRQLKRFPTEGEVGDSEAGEESDATANHPREAIFRGLEPDQQRKQGMSDRERLDRLEMSKRLNALMSNPSTSQAGSIFGVQPGSKPRRKREVFGRARSNVSAASSGSAGSTSGLVLSREYQAASIQNESTSVASEYDTFIEPSNESGSADVEENAPPATQLGYEVPGAKQFRKIMMDKLEGRGTTTIENHVQEPEKVRLSDFEPHNADASTSRRTTRRQAREQE